MLIMYLKFRFTLKGVCTKFEVSLYRFSFQEFLSISNDLMIQEINQVSNINGLGLTWYNLESLITSS